MPRTPLGYWLLAFAVLGPAARAGEYTYTVVHPNPSVVPTSVYADGRADFAKPQPGSGTVHANATVATLRVGERAILVAIDTREPTDTVPNVMRFDFTGQGRFDNAVVLPAKIQRYGDDADRYSLAADGRVEVSLAGQKAPFRVTCGYHHFTPRDRYVWMSLFVVADGTCRFGDRERAVRLFDRSGDLAFSTPPRPKLVAGQVPAFDPGDEIRIDLSGDGTFRHALTAYYGQPVQVDGAWYDLVVNTEQRTVTAQPTSAPAAQLHIDHSDWSATLVSTQRVLRLAGGHKPVRVPPDRYHVVGYEQFGPADLAGRRAEVTCALMRPEADREIEVCAGGVTNLAVGTPLVGRVTGVTSGDPAFWREVSLMLELRDRAGLAVRNLAGPNGKPPPAPTFKIADAAGKTVLSGKLEYG